MHALWSCTGLNEVWDGDSWSFHSNIQFTDFKELCSWILENGKPMELFIVQVWSIWNQRNKLRLNQSCCLTKDLQKMAVESWNEICRSNLRLNRLSSSPTHHNVWTAPAPDSRGGARNFCLGGPICVANLLVYTNFYIHTQTHVSIHTQN